MVGWQVLLSVARNLGVLATHAQRCAQELMVSRTPKRTSKVSDHKNKETQRWEGALVGFLGWCLTCSTFYVGKPQRGICIFCICFFEHWRRCREWNPYPDDVFFFQRIYHRDLILSRSPICIMDCEAAPNMNILNPNVKVWRITFLCKPCLWYYISTFCRPFLSDLHQNILAEFGET